MMVCILKTYTNYTINMLINHKDLHCALLIEKLCIFLRKYLMKFVENQSGTYRNFSQNFTKIALSGYILGF